MILPACLPACLPARPPTDVHNPITVIDQLVDPEYKLFYDLRRVGRVHKYIFYGCCETEMNRDGIRANLFALMVGRKIVKIW